MEHLQWSLQVNVSTHNVCTDRKTLHPFTVDEQLIVLDISGIQHKSVSTVLADHIFASSIFVYTTHCNAFAP